MKTPPPLPLSKGKAALEIGLYLAVFLMAQLAAVLLTFIWLLIKGKITPDQLGDSELLMTQAGEEMGVMLFFASLAAIGFLFFVRMVRRDCLRNVSSARQWAFSLIGVLFLGNGLGLLLHPFGLTDGGTGAMFEQMKGNALAVLSIAVVAPIFEELLMREGIQRTLRRAGCSPWLAISGAALLFGALHGNFFQAIPAIFAGLYLGYLMERTDTVALPIGAHIANNSMAVLAMLFPALDIEEKVVPHLSSPLCMTVGAVLIALAVGCVRWAFPARR